jgi:UDP-GlcNAc:undecaprenyl-phosphate GlcNAc-1-phosphate transferase
MSGVWPAVALVSASVSAAILGALAVRASPRSLMVENWSGRLVPAVLGWALVGGAIVGLAVVGVAWSGGDRAADALLFAGAGMAALLTAGFLDDLRGQHARGFREHLATLARGRVTTGIVKLVVGLAVGVGLALWAGGGALRVVASAVVIVVSINLWNAFDVVPGRALKLGALVLVGALALGLDRPAGIIAAAGLGAAAGVLPLDLAERGMLGDTGSNPLGLMAGLALALVLPTWGVVVAAGAALALQVAAETVTITRLIESVPPFRWADGLGRRS